jgi:protease II
MKKSFFLYAFILVALMNIFTYMFLSKQVEFEQNLFDKTTKRLKDSLTSVTTKLNDANYFSLEKNENAQNYFDSADSEKVIQYEKLIPFVTEKLLDLNANPKGNPYVGQDQIGANKFIINKVRILNHRWIIADFSDGEYWGEVVLKYFVNEDETITFEISESLLYQK